MTKKWLERPANDMSKPFESIEEYVYSKVNKTKFNLKFGENESQLAFYQMLKNIDDHLKAWFDAVLDESTQGKIGLKKIRTGYNKKTKTLVFNVPAEETGTYELVYTVDDVVDRFENGSDVLNFVWCIETLPFCRKIWNGFRAFHRTPENVRLIKGHYFYSSTGSFDLTLEEVAERIGWTNNASPNLVYIEKNK